MASFSEHLAKLRIKTKPASKPVLAFGHGANKRQGRSCPSATPNHPSSFFLFRLAGLSKPQIEKNEPQS